MEHDRDVLDDAVKRLRRVEGQVRGLIGMIEDERDCREVVVQVAAAARGLEQVGFRLIASGLRTCVRDPDAAHEAGYSVQELERLFLRVG